MNRKKLEKIIREEIVNERADGRLAQIIAGTVDKLIIQLLLDLDW
ncbi:MAG: hypothetical protein ACFFKA_07420 [Candidatus Thorarchaeota archaeon]